MENRPLDLEPTCGGDPVELVGRYEVDPIPGGKRFQGAWLVLDDGTRYVIAYRPLAEHFLFLDKQVCITGRPYVPGSDTQHVRATHLQIHSIELAPGETPYAVPPTEPVLPPVVRTADEVSGRDGRWARVVGKVTAMEDDPDGYLPLVRLCLDDGTEVVARNVLRSDWTRYVGETVTVTSRVARVTEGDAVALELVGWRAVDEGDVSLR